MKAWQHVVVWLPIGAGACFLAYAIMSTHTETAAKNKPAIEAGFADYSEMEAAKAAGFADSSKWREELRQRELRLKIAQDEAARKAAERAAQLRAAAAVEEARQQELRRDPATRMTMPSFTWKIGGFGSIGIVTVTIENGNDFAVKDIGIRCTFDGKSGTQLSAASHTIFDTIKAKSRQTFREVNIGFINSQSARAGCSVETARRF
jgi:hypothetical protein